jgi:hypothetical protein
MAAIAKALSHATGVEIDADTLKPVLIFSGIGLVVSLLAILTYGLDLSPGFF